MIHHIRQRARKRGIVTYGGCVTLGIVKEKMRRKKRRLSARCGRDQGCIVLYVVDWHLVGSVGARVTFFNWISPSKCQHRPVTSECARCAEHLVRGLGTPRPLAMAMLTGCYAAVAWQVAGQAQHERPLNGLSCLRECSHVIGA